MPDEKKKTPVRPLPNPKEADTAPFWAGTKEGELRFQRCDDCETLVFYPRHHCTNCLGRNLSWHVSKGEGTVYTYGLLVASNATAGADAVNYRTTTNLIATLAPAAGTPGSPIDYRAATNNVLMGGFAISNVTSIAFTTNTTIQTTGTLNGTNGVRWLDNGTNYWLLFQ